MKKLKNTESAQLYTDNVCDNLIGTPNFGSQQASVDKWVHKLLHDSFLGVVWNCSTNPSDKWLSFKNFFCLFFSVRRYFLLLDETNKNIKTIEVLKKKSFGRLFLSNPRSLTPSLVEANRGNNGN